MARRKREQNRSLSTSTPMSPEEFAKAGYGDLLDKLPAAQMKTNQIIQTGKGDVQIAGFQANAAGLIVPDNVTLESIDSAAFLLFSMEGRIQLWIGDLLNAAEQLEYGAIKDIAEKFSRDPQTLYNWKALSSSVTISLRRELLEQFPDAKPLSKSHYELVQAMPVDEQRHWLSIALENDLGVAKLRAAISEEEKSTNQSDDADANWMRPYSKFIDQILNGRYKTLDKRKRRKIYQELRQLVETLGEEFED